MSIRNPQKSAQFEESAESLLLYRRSGAEAYGISHDEFAAILDEVERKTFPALVPDPETKSKTNPDGQNTDGQKATFRAGLRVEELAIARACAAGNERAWQDFIERYRPKLQQVALHITRDGALADELAGSLFADLYGVNVRDGVRNSKLSSYTGRGSLEGWLRTVMAQEFINRYRKQKRTVSLDEQSEDGVQFAAPEPAPTADADERLEAATDEALAELSAEDRFTLAAYYLDGRTLADVARMLGLHESSVSRRLDRLASAIRKRILAGLKIRGMSHAQAAEALETDVRDLRLNLRARLTQDPEDKTFLKSKSKSRTEPRDALDSSSG
jgi:RNA polymerase sigma-70 factor (ECF subfamily)